MSLFWPLNHRDALIFTLFSWLDIIIIKNQPCLNKNMPIHEKKEGRSLIIVIVLKNIHSSTLPLSLQFSFKTHTNSMLRGSSRVSQAGEVKGVREEEARRQKVKERGREIWRHLIRANLSEATHTHTPTSSFLSHTHTHP